jgi:carbohydrate kinase (thermoresistant glucokinase family)
MTLVLVVMGVAGSGKTTVGEALAERLGWPFQDGDAFHPAANVEKMRAGEPLNDQDRASWLEQVADWIGARLAEDEDGVITCSALKRAYRDQLRRGGEAVRFVYLVGDQGTLAARISGRAGHFFPASLLASQFAALEPPTVDEDAIVTPVDLPVDAQVELVIRRLAGE